MPTKRIMVIEADDERFKQVNFLLRLAGYESRHVATIEEAVNLARVCQHPAEGALCLLVNSVTSPESGLTLLQTLAHYAFPLPVVLVRRGDWEGPAANARFPALHVLYCLPTTINAALTAIGQSHPQRRSAAPEQISA